MPESVAMVLVLSITIWLALGLLLAHWFRAEPAKAHGILVAGLLGSLATPLLFFAVQQINWGLLPQQTEIPHVASMDPVEETQAAALPVAAGVSPIEPSEIVATPPEERPSEPALPVPKVELLPVNGMPISAGLEIPRTSQAESQWPTLQGLFLWSWFALSLAMTLRLLIDFYSGYRLVRASQPLTDRTSREDLERCAQRMGLKRAPNLCVSAHTQSPVIWGWSWPATLLIPNQPSSRATSEGVYLHELAHLARHDCLWALLADVVTCLVPWHPLTWWTKRTMAVRSEEACDDWAVACGCPPTDYAEDLVNLAPSSTGSLTLAAVSRGSKLKDRVGRLLRGSLVSPRLGRRWLGCVGFVAVVLTGFLAVLQPRTFMAGASDSGMEAVLPGSDPSAGLPEAPDAAGTTEILVQSDGKSVAGANVWVAQWSDSMKGFAWDGPVLSDQKGLASFAVAKQKARLALGKSDSGQLDFIWLTSSPGQRADSILNLKPSNEIEATITHQGKAISGVKCKPLVLFKTGTDRLVDLFKIGVPLSSTKFPELLSAGLARSDEQGKVRFADVPSGCGIGCEIIDERYAWSLTQLTPGGKNGIELAEPGTLELQFEGASEALPATAFQWFLAPKGLENRGITPTSHYYLTSNFFSEEFKPRNANLISQIAPGQYNLVVKNHDTSAYFFDKKMQVAIESNKHAVVKIAVKSRVLVQGRIVDAITGKGISHYPFQLYSSHGYWDDPKAVIAGKVKVVQEWAEGKTDEKGDYETYVQGNGRYGFTYSLLSDGSEWDRYQPSGFDRTSRTFGVEADVPQRGKFAFPELRLSPTFNLQGNIVDNQNRPWKGTIDLYCPVSRAWRPVSEGFTPEAKPAAVREGGSFQLAGLPADATLTFRARSGKAVNIPAAIPPEQWKKNGFRVALDERNGVTFAGTVQDQSGTPVPGARLTLYCYFQPGGFRPGRYQKKRMEEVVTDEQGKFAFVGHWPGERYHLTIERDGYYWPGLPTTARDRKLQYDLEVHNSLVSGPKNENLHIEDMKTGRPGETVDLGILRVIKNDNPVRGKVVDTDGKPISGIHVVAAADGRGGRESKTNATGQFEIGNLIEGYGFLIARGAGYRATYVSFHTGDSDITIAMRRTSEPALPPSVISKAHLASRDAMVRHVLESIWKTREVNGWGGRMLEYMADLDLARAKEWVEPCAEPEKSMWASVLTKHLTSDPSGKAKTEELVRLALGNLEDGIAAAKSGQPADPFLLLRVAEKLLEQNKAGSLRFAEEAVIITRALPANDRRSKIWAFASAGEVVWHAGNKEAGKKLIQEAIEILEQDPKSPSFGVNCTSIAVHLAARDWPEAKRLLDQCQDPEEFNRGLSSCILNIAREDLPAARAKLSLFKELNGMISGSPNGCRLDLARLVAAKDPKAALSVIEDLPSMGAFQETYAQGLVEIALQMHSKDPEGAYRLVDQAFDFLDQLGTSRCPVLQAQIIYRIRKTGYPDPHSLMARTLASLGGPPDGHFLYQKSKWKETAFALAFTDPQLARKVLLRHSTIEELTDEWLAGLQGGRGERRAGFLLAMTAPKEAVKAFDAASAKGWTKESVSKASLSEIFGSLAKLGDLMENVEHWERLAWFK